MWNKKKNQNVYLEVNGNKYEANFNTGDELEGFIMNSATQKLMTLMGDVKKSVDLTVKAREKDVNMPKFAQKEAESEPVEEPEVVEADPEFKCGFCGKQLPDNKLYMIHLQARHQNEL
jgi:hypothetical protein